ncbi:MAG: hypothetical protein ABWK01_08535 [Infirmifilum sp.]
MIEEIDKRMKSYSPVFQKYMLIHEDEGNIEILEIYLFNDWGDWRRLMDSTIKDDYLEELWKKFEALVEGEIIEEDWEVIE